jgi:hypothetical protein
MRRLVALAVLVSIGCTKTKSSGDAESTPGEGLPDAVDAAAPMDGREEALWAAAAQGDPEELMRLEDEVGCRGLRERAVRADLRSTALRAMKYCPDFSELPWLARIAGDRDDGEARMALETIDALAARPRRAVDPEDADELHAGCEALVALARETSRPQGRRVLAVRALRMLADRGCVKPGEIPGAVSARPGD